MPKLKPEPKKPGRPKLAEADAKGKIVPVRFESDDFKLVADAAKAKEQTVSAWIRQTLRAAAETEMFDGTLHKAIHLVLSERESGKATTGEIAKEIGRLRLYQRKDGAVARAAQINARVRHYPELFQFVDSGVVGLVTKSSATRKG
jgi:hypothetical protein